MHYGMCKLFMACGAATLLWTSGCATVNFNPATWEWPTLAGAREPVGSAAWWKKNKSEAKFVPHEGFQVAGAPGYYDQEGRPIKTQVAKAIREEKSDQGLLKDVQFSQSVAELKSRVGMGLDQRLAEQSYAQGEDWFRREQYGEAAKKFKQTIARWPDSVLEQDARFFLGECNFFADDYPAAIGAYEKLLEKYPNSPHLDKIVKRQFAIARYWEAHHQHRPHWPVTPNLIDDTRPMFDTLGQALKIYENIRLNDPTGPMADDAIMATANSYFLRGRYNDADYQYKLIRSEYPRSEHQYEAHVLGLQCKLRKYQGPDYDGSPLEEAKKLAKQLRVHFAGELSAEERQRQADIRGTLNRNLAERDMKIAKYYDDTEYYRSAKFYYAKIAREFPDTPLAQQALARYREIGGEPDKPATKLKWLVDVFPENAERQAIGQVPLLGSESATRIATQPDKESSNVDSKTIRR
ncbi:MAG: outer membrane protein assembly factor BamD [Pirellulales bacterium]|nr:outer membrane protein assembly factor BamD [Pirellulales bacterium]